MMMMMMMMMMKQAVFIIFLPKLKSKKVLVDNVRSLMMMMMMMMMMKQAVFIIILPKLKSKKVHVDILRSLAFQCWVRCFCFSIVSSCMYSTIGEAQNKAGSLNTAWLKNMDSISQFHMSNISWIIHGMWMMYIAFERGGPKFSNTTARALA